MTLKKSIVFAILVIGLFPIGNSFSQYTDTSETLQLKFANFNPHHFKAEDGTTVIVGEIKNTKGTPVSNVQIWGGFFNDFDKQPLESAIGTTVLEVIPGYGKSAFMIKSPSANPAITSVSVNLLGFKPAAEKQTTLQIEPGTVDVSDKLTIPISITNNGLIKATNTKIHIIFYDVFEPPRILGIESKALESEISPGDSKFVEFVTSFNSKMSGFDIVAESSNSISNVDKVAIIPPEIRTKLVTIQDISISDNDGNKIANANIGKPISIGSKIVYQYLVGQDAPDQEYVYFVQIKQSGEKAFVEFIGQSEGDFDNSRQQLPTVQWTPQSSGLYFVETFVWDKQHSALASKGPITLINVLN